MNYFFEAKPDYAYIAKNFNLRQCCFDTRKALFRVVNTPPLRSLSDDKGRGACWEIYHTGSGWYQIKSFIGDVQIRKITIRAKAPRKVEFDAEREYLVKDAIRSIYPGDRTYGSLKVSSNITRNSVEVLEDNGTKYTVFLTGQHLRPATDTNGNYRIKRVKP